MFRLEAQQGVARLIIDRAEARNAIPASQWQALAETAEGSCERGARLLLLEGAGSAFCAGADLGDFAAMRGDAAAASRFRESMRDALDRVGRLPIPTVAAIDGACFGAGVALALACDLRLAGPGASFAITPARFGISFPQQDIARLVALIGPGQASRLLLAAEPLDGVEAARIGLVEIFAQDGAAAEAARLAALVQANDALSLTALKRGVALAAAGIVSDSGQDRAFDEMLASDVLHRRLAAVRKRR